ncbi:leucyl/phenylalanyl-tRNA--protein transferase [Sphingomonas baiyangensis]|uniref:Leucyl/phenylalanyl-tRNA--protein transferase n=1 Tax=Sphingomonas baiyangensis TaxID=2572576 RepID=A0A4U1KZR2_9SPHN|nr:leucyl/phenylalanyl-tRNA--protein transferase [Sphingomonas baiyangensis]TKD49919.1 leucyl/phenylalanyl-tRNA--protein transferase [Sphingomonas baiyangensis]
MTRRLSLYQQLDPELVLRAYAMGVFPMADHRDAPGVYWVEPKLRGILPLDGFRLSRSLRKTIVRERFRVTADQAFNAIMGLCAEPAADRPETWINTPIARVFARLHEMGFAHSIECWEGDRLVGGLYGLALGRAFFGESMVSRATDASKVALAWLVARLRVGGFELLDCQFQTGHLQSLGAIEIDRDHYMALLGSALGDSVGGLALGAASVDGAFDALDRLGAAPALPAAASPPSTVVSSAVSGKVIAQLLGHTS